MGCQPSARGRGLDLDHPSQRGQPGQPPGGPRCKLSGTSTGIYLHYIPSYAQKCNKDIYIYIKKRFNMANSQQLINLILNRILEGKKKKYKHCNTRT